MNHNKDINELVIHELLELSRPMIIILDINQILINRKMCSQYVM